MKEPRHIQLFNLHTVCTAQPVNHILYTMLKIHKLFTILILSIHTVLTLHTIKTEYSFLTQHNVLNVKTVQTVFSKHFTCYTLYFLHGALCKHYAHLIIYKLYILYSLQNMHTIISTRCT